MHCPKLCGHYKRGRQKPPVYYHLKIFSISEIVYVAWFVIVTVIVAI